MALTASGGAGMFKRSELEPLYRDVRGGGFHLANTMLTHEIVGKTTLGIGLGEQPRWGHAERRAPSSVGAMPLFMDIHHKIEGLTPEAVAAAHQ
jgi:hypothetical protein